MTTSPDLRARLLKELDAIDAIASDTENAYQDAYQRGMRCATDHLRDALADWAGEAASSSPSPAEELQQETLETLRASLAALPSATSNPSDTKE